MGKRYYCEYCDKSFSDNPTMRKNHMKGGVHQRMKKIHYDSFRDPKVILNDELCKKPCRKFSYGDCHFGDSCMFSHLTDERRRDLEAQIRAQKEAKERRRDQTEPSLDDWLAKRSITKSKSTDSEPYQEMTTVVSEQHVFHLPASLSSYTNLPPSVIPPNPEDLRLPCESTWG